MLRVCLTIKNTNSVRSRKNFAAWMLANQTLWWIMQGGPGADPHRFPPFHWKRSDFWNCGEANIFYFFLRIKVNSQVHADFQSQQHRKCCFRVKSQQFSGETLAPSVLAKLENGPIFSWIRAWGPSCACLTTDPRNLCYCCLRAPIPDLSVSSPHQVNPSL